MKDNHFVLTFITQLHCSGRA